MNRIVFERASVRRIRKGAKLELGDGGQRDERARERVNRTYQLISVCRLASSQNTASELLVGGHK